MTATSTGSRLRRFAALASSVFLPVLLVQAGPPLPESNFLYPYNAGPCTADTGNPYEAAQYRQEGWSDAALTRYPGACRRLHFTYGPIAVKPGQNDVLISPTTIEKPAYDGYLVRFKPNLVRADGSVPPIEQIHLHHAVWLSLFGGPQNFSQYGYGSSGSEVPFFASGEEKTITNLPRGYGLPVNGSDQWQILYMVHNQTSQPDRVWITYDIDYVAAGAVAHAGLKATYPIWLDVRPSTYPVFNVQRGYGHKDPITGRLVCTWPQEQTAGFDPWGNKITGQGAPGNGTGTGLTLPARGQPFGRARNFTGGTLIALGGHLHPGGLSVGVDLQRGSQRQRIFTSEAHYWSWTYPTVEGGPPTSWDLSMSVTGLTKWGVHVEPGDTIWLNATYDAQVESTYEDMGISVGWVAPDDAKGPTAPSLNPFTAPTDTAEGCPSGGLPAGYLCDKGWVTHGHMAEAANHGGPNGTISTNRLGAQTTQVAIGAFQFSPGDQSTIQSTGIPTVPIGGSLTFNNLDAWGDVYHSITSCAYPCTGPTGIAFPLGDGRSSLGDAKDFDSGQLGYEPEVFVGQHFGPAKDTTTWTLPVTSLNGFKPGAIYTYYCRVHPFMRGVFAVTAAGTAPAAAPATPGPAPPAPGGEWRTFGHDLSNTRNQDAEKLIGTGNASQLAPAWTFSSLAAGGEGDFTGTPIVADGYILAASNRGWVFALNADSGQLVWKTKLPAGGVNSTLAVDGGRVYAAVSHPTSAPGTPAPNTGGPYLAALNEATGKPIWTTKLDTQPGSDVYASPIVYQGVVIIGVSGEAAELGPQSDRIAFHGSLNFLDAATGALLKKTYSIPQSDWSKGYAGGGIWSTPAVDPATNTAYVGSGNPFQKDKEHPHTDAILKFDVNRSSASFGQIVGVYKGNVDTYTDVHTLPCVPIPGNNPPYYPQGLGSCGQIDLDFGAAPNLFKGADGKLEVGDAQKAGVYHVLDAATMKGLWKQIVAAPVPTVGGVVGSSAFDGNNVYGPEVVGGYLWSLDSRARQPRWVSPVAGGLDEEDPITYANGIVYTLDAKGFLDAYDAKTGIPLLHRPMMLGANSGNSPVLSWGGVSVARHTVYAAVGITGLSDGLIVAFRPGGGGGGGPLPVPGAPSSGPVGATIVAGPGAYLTTYATPVMTVRVAGLLNFINNDLPQHDVTAVDLGSDGKPLFQSKLIGLGEVAQVAGTDRLVAGRSYAFYCSIHPGMRGTLIAAP